MVSTKQVPACYCDFQRGNTNSLEKIGWTLRNRRTQFDATDCTDLPNDILERYDQVIFCKRQIDPFDEPRVDRMLTELEADEFILKNTDGSYDYEIIDIGNGKGRNILQFDLNKIEIKAKPFINAEVAGLMSSEQEVIAAWNVFIGKESSVEEDDQMVQNANAGDHSWSYEEDLPLSQDNKVIFEKKYAEYFMKNYLKQFITMKLPIVEEDAAVFDLAEGKKAKAQKYVDDNNLN